MKALAFAVLASCALVAGQAGTARRAPPCAATSIVVYHRFGPNVVDSMTVRVTTFRSQLAYLQQHHHPVVTLRALVTCLNGGTAIPEGAVAIRRRERKDSFFLKSRFAGS